MKDALKILPPHAGITLLHRAEKTFFRGDERPRAVHVDASAFEHNPVNSLGTPLEVDRRVPTRQAEQLRHSGGDPSSSCQSSYFAQPLNFQSRMARADSRVEFEVIVIVGCPSSVPFGAPHHFGNKVAAAVEPSFSKKLDRSPRVQTRFVGQR